MSTLEIILLAYVALDIVLTTSVVFALVIKTMNRLFPRVRKHKHHYYTYE